MARQPEAEAGARMRAALMGDDGFKAGASGLDDWVRTFQQEEAQHVWSAYWTRDGLDARSRSICALSVLMALGFLDDFEQLLRGVLKEKLLSRDEVRELILQCPSYIGYPRTLGARKIAERLFGE